jgi:hypothetical protein
LPRNPAVPLFRARFAQRYSDSLPPAFYLAAAAALRFAMLPLMHHAPDGRRWAYFALAFPFLRRAPPAMPPAMLELVRRPA